jgi:hypothetical protein
MEEQKAVIYKLFCNDETIKDIYVGSTVNFYGRVHQHKTLCKKNTLPLYNFINQHGGFSNWKFEIIDEFIAYGRKQILQKERYWYNELKPTLNKQRPSISYEETIEYHANFRALHKEEKKEYNTKYYSKNKQYWIDYYNKKKLQIQNINITISFD